MIAITSGEIHLWLAFYDEINDESVFSAHRSVLNEVERRQESRFYFVADRRRYLVTRALVRTVLSHYAPLSPERWVFSTNRYGRPQIANEEGRVAGLSFNVSHTHSVIVLAVAKCRELGVDVENVYAGVSIDLADRFFAPHEVEALGRLPPDLRRDRFFEYWTFKESYIKARGMGLSIPLDKFSFNCEHDHRVALTIHPDLGDNPMRWQFWQFRPTSSYLVAICAERLDSSRSQLVVRKVVPMADEELFATVVLRTSE